MHKNKEQESGFASGRLVHSVQKTLVVYVRRCQKHIMHMDEMQQQHVRFVNVLEPIQNSLTNRERKGGRQGKGREGASGNRGRDVVISPQIAACWLAYGTCFHEEGTRAAWVDLELGVDGDGDGTDFLSVVSRLDPKISRTNFSGREIFALKRFGLFANARDEIDK
ncbi:hypothetical protein AXG93_1774s1290 [Marchantia polymorpha subsp. ruderalis]|uniref:Uncharacterized protein n=1 Tax=Marchantia polymorpha subsp. ruderalis TaxID=1480154 RepID=A0A176W1W4_MARPO|nr:hypothetical protein AXG93_1774s1290 [Marchantia polymorpha subsp. ruderalis]